MRVYLSFNLRFRNVSNSRNDWEVWISLHAFVQYRELADYVKVMAEKVPTGLDYFAEDPSMCSFAGDGKFADPDSTELICVPLPGLSSIETQWMSDAGPVGVRRAYDRGEALKMSEDGLRNFLKLNSRLAFNPKRMRGESDDDWTERSNDAEKRQGKWIDVPFFQNLAADLSQACSDCRNNEGKRKELAQTINLLFATGSRVLVPQPLGKTDQQHRAAGLLLKHALLDEAVFSQRFPGFSAGNVLVTGTPSMLGQTHLVCSSSQAKSMSAVTGLELSIGGQKVILGGAVDPQDLQANTVRALTRRYFEKFFSALEGYVVPDIPLWALHLDRPGSVEGIRKPLQSRVQKSAQWVDLQRQELLDGIGTVFLYPEALNPSREAIPRKAFFKSRQKVVVRIRSREGEAPNPSPKPSYVSLRAVTVLPGQIIALHALEPNEQYALLGFVPDRKGEDWPSLEDALRSERKPHFLLPGGDSSSLAGLFDARVGVRLFQLRAALMNVGVKVDKDQRIPVFIGKRNQVGRVFLVGTLPSESTRVLSHETPEADGSLGQREEVWSDAVSEEDGAKIHGYALTTNPAGDLNSFSVLVHDGHAFEMSPSSDGLHRQVTIVLPNGNNASADDVHQQVVLEDLQGFTALHVYSRRTSGIFPPPWRLITGGETATLLPCSLEEVACGVPTPADVAAAAAADDDEKDIHLRFHVALRAEAQTARTILEEDHKLDSTIEASVNRFESIRVLGAQEIDLLGMHPDGAVKPIKLDKADSPKTYRTFIDDPVVHPASVGRVERSAASKRFIGVQYDPPVDGSQEKVSVELDRMLLVPDFKDIVLSKVTSPGEASLLVGKYRKAWESMAEMRYAEKIYLMAVSFVYDQQRALESGRASQQISDALTLVIPPKSAQVRSAELRKNNDDLNQHIKDVFGERFKSEGEARINDCVEIVDATDEFRRLFKVRFEGDSWKLKKNDDVWRVEIPWRVGAAVNESLAETANLVEFRLVIERGSALAPMHDAERWVSDAPLQEDACQKEASGESVADGDQRALDNYVRACRIGSAPLEESSMPVVNKKSPTPIVGQQISRPVDDYSVRERIAHDPSGKYAFVLVPTGSIKPPSKSSLLVDVTAFGFLPLQVQPAAGIDVPIVINDWFDWLAGLLTLQGIERDVMAKNLDAKQLPDRSKVAEILDRVDAIDSWLTGQLIRRIVDELFMQQPSTEQRPDSVRAMGVPPELKQYLNDELSRNLAKTWRAKAFLYLNLPNAHKRSDLFSTSLDLTMGGGKPKESRSFNVLSLVGSASTPTGGVNQVLGHLLPLNDDIVHNEIEVSNVVTATFESQLERASLGDQLLGRIVTATAFAGVQPASRVPSGRVRLASRQPLAPPQRLFMGQVWDGVDKKIPPQTLTKAMLEKYLGSATRPAMGPFVGASLVNLLTPSRESIVGVPADNSMPLELQFPRDLRTVRAPKDAIRSHLTAWFLITADEEKGFENDDFVLRLRPVARRVAQVSSPVVGGGGPGQDPGGQSDQPDPSALSALSRQLPTRPFDGGANALPKESDLKALLELVQRQKPARSLDGPSCIPFTISHKQGQYSVALDRVACPADATSDPQFFLFSRVGQSIEAKRKPRQFVIACIVSQSRWQAWSIELQHKRNGKLRFSPEFENQLISETPEAAFRSIVFEREVRQVRIKRNAASALELISGLFEHPRIQAPMDIGLIDGNTIGISVAGLHRSQRMVYSLKQADESPAAVTGKIERSEVERFPLTLLRVDADSVKAIAKTPWFSKGYSSYEVGLSWYDANNGEFYRVAFEVDFAD